MLDQKRYECKGDNTRKKRESLETKTATNARQVIELAALNNTQNTHIHHNHGVVFICNIGQLLKCI